MPNVRDFAGETPPLPALAFDEDPAEWIEAPPGDPADDLAAIRINLFQGGPGAPFRVNGSKDATSPPFCRYPPSSAR